MQNNLLILNFRTHGNMQRPQEKSLLAQEAQVLDLSNYNSSSCGDFNEKSTMFMKCLDPTDAITSSNEDLSCEQGRA